MNQQIKVYCLKLESYPLFRRTLLNSSFAQLNTFLNFHCPVFSPQNDETVTFRRLKDMVRNPPSGYSR